MKKKEVMPFATTCMNLGSIMLNEKDQMEKDKYCMESCICGNGFKKKKRNSWKQRVNGGFQGLELGEIDRWSKGTSFQLFIRTKFL